MQRTSDTEEETKLEHLEGAQKLNILAGVCNYSHLALAPGHNNEKKKQEDSNQRKSKI